MISIITPVYNGRDFIAACIEVVNNQSCPRLEHIIVDGGSIDNTIEIIKQYANCNSHIRWVSEKDRGQSDAINKGIAIARGNIVGILNVDDFYEPNVLNKVREIFRTLPDPSLLVGNCNVWNAAGELMFVNKPERLKLTDLLLGPSINPFPMNPSAYFYHKVLHEKIGFYNVDEHYALDLDFLLRAVQVANVKYMDETWGNFRMLGGTKSVNDIQSGRVSHRIERVISTYWKDLPLLHRWQLAMKYMIKSKLWSGLKYYADNPQELPVLKAKLKRIFGFTQ